MTQVRVGGPGSSFWVIRLSGLSAFSAALECPRADNIHNGNERDKRAP